MENRPFFISIPHSGEEIPDEVHWLKSLPEPTLMRDVDRFVRELYQPVISRLQILNVLTTWHRYVVDLNREENQFDEDSVYGAPSPSGSQTKGIHWSKTTQGEVLISQPMSLELHEKLVALYFRPFHREVQQLRSKIKDQFGEVFQLDAHSMPSLGTALHSDPGQDRPEIVVSDFHGRSCRSEYRDLVMEAYQRAGFEVAYNWPYVGGGITQRYGEPQEKMHCIQVELNRKLYMDEGNKQKTFDTFPETQKKLDWAVDHIVQNIGQLLDSSHG